MGVTIPVYTSQSQLCRNYDTIDPSDNVNIIQQFFNDAQPDVYGINTSLDVKLVNLSDTVFHLQDCMFDHSRIQRTLKEFDCVIPRLMTAMSPPRPANSLKELLKAVEKRNCAVPRVQVTMDVYAKATELFKKTLFYVYGDVKKYDDISITREDVVNWIETQDSKLATIIERTSITDLALNRYNLTIKKNSKPLLDVSAVNTYASLQTVVYSKKDFNTYYCPIFKIIKKRMMRDVVDKVLMFADVPPHEFGRKMTKQLSTVNMDVLHSLEFDVSKYDKSQALLHLLVDCMLLRHFGMTDEDTNRWFIGHAYTVLYDPSTKLTVHNYFQRKSGDPSTWILNTQQVLVMIINVIDVKQWDSITLIAASGDDSEILSTVKLDINVKRFADVFNYEVKVYDKYRSIYFCSKFMVLDEGTVYMIPDLLKIVKKLGRHDMKNQEHVLSYRRSVLDSLKDFIVPDAVKVEYVNSINERHRMQLTSFDSIVNALFDLALDDDKFEKLYIPNKRYRDYGYGALADL